MENTSAPLGSVLKEFAGYLFGQMKATMSLSFVRTGGVIYALLSGALLAFPLFNILGYEFSAVISLVASIIAGYITIALYKRDSINAENIENAEAESPEQFFRMYRKSVLVNEALLIIPFLIVSAGMLFIENCAYGEGIFYYTIYPCITVIVASGIAAFICATRVKHPRMWFVLLWLATFAYHVFAAYYNPALFTYWWAVGFFPGLQYDMTMRITDTLLFARLGHMVVALALLLSGAMLAGTRAPKTLARFSQASRDALQLRGVSAVAGILVAACIFAFTFRCELGFERTHAYIEHRLSESYQTEHFTFMFPKNALSQSRLQWIADRSEFFYNYESQYLPQPPQGQNSRITVYFYPPETKKFLLGSRSTSFTKPWLQEIHLDLDQFDDIFPHELVHALCAPYGIPVLNTSLSMGMEEGIAVALDNMAHGSGLKLDRDALGIIRDLPANNFAKVFSKTGFAYGNVEANYRVAGSFVKYLITKFGAAKFRSAFATADFSAIGNYTLDEFRQDWIGTLSQAGVAAPPIWATQHSYGSTFLFSTNCAHYVANTIEDAERYSTDGYTARAISMLEDLLAAHANRDAMNALLREFLAKRDFDSVETVYRHYLPNDSSYTRAATAMYRGDIAEAAAMFASIDAVDSMERSPELDVRMRICAAPVLYQDTDIIIALRQLNYDGVVEALSGRAGTAGKDSSDILRALCYIAEARKRAQWGEYDSSEAILGFVDTPSIVKPARVKPIGSFNAAYTIPNSLQMLQSADFPAYCAYCRIHVVNLLHLSKTENAAQFMETVRHSMNKEIFDRDLTPWLRYAEWKLQRASMARL